MTGSGANNRDVKKINRIRTIRSIFSCDRISQPELAAKVNNSWPTVLQNVKELMAMGLVQEVGTFESTGGRKAIICRAVISDGKIFDIHNNLSYIFLNARNGTEFM